jgi:hypothetical protein
MHNILTLASKINPATVFNSFDLAARVIETFSPRNAYVYFHGNEFISLRDLSPQQTRRLEKLNLTVRNRDPYIDSDGKQRTQPGKKILVQAPTLEVIEYLVSLKHVRPYKHELALDMIPSSDGECGPVTAAFQRCLVQPYAGKRQAYNFKGTQYSAMPRKGPEHKWCGYGDNPSNVVSNSKKPCIHIEDRYRGLPFLRQMGIEKTADFLTFDLKGHWCRLEEALCYLDVERLGRYVSNLETKSRRQKLLTIDCSGFLFNMDRAKGGAFYAAHSMSRSHEEIMEIIERQRLGIEVDDRMVAGRHLQSLIQHIGRGPYIRKLDISKILNRIEPVWGPVRADIWRHIIH